MTFKEFQRFLLPIKQKIYLLMGRAILTAIDNTGMTQTLRVSVLKDEMISGVERLQEYGFETYPDITTSEALILFPDGNRNNGLAIVIHDRSNRPMTLSPKDVRMYDSRGNNITCKSTGIEMEESTGVGTLKIGPTAIEINGNTDNLVTWTDLNLALQTFVTALNTAFTTKQDAAMQSAGTLTLDISGAKTNTIKVP